MRLPSSMLSFVAACALFLGCSEPAEITETASGDRAVRLALNWYPEAEHGGFYSADVEGHFAEQNLEVEIIPGGPSAPQLVITELVAGRVHFAVSDADQVVKARSEGLPIVAVMATMQKSPRCIMVHESTGIGRLEDLSNVQLAISESRPFALWMRHKLALKDVEFVPFNGLVGEFLQKERFAQQAYVFSEPFIAQEQGSDPRALMLSETGFNPYAGLLITTDTMVSEQPDIVAAMVKASMAGWKDYLQTPEATNTLIHSLNSDMSPEALTYGAEQVAELCRSEDGGIDFSMSLQRWETLVRQIEEIEEIPASSVDPSDCFTAKFVDSAIPR